MGTAKRAEAYADSPLSSKRPLRLLIVEDSPADAELMVAFLKRAGYLLSFDVVDSPAAFQDRLRQTDCDVILSDHNLRTWTGMDALEILQRSEKKPPFVIVTATLGDEAAVEYIKRGAADYLLKHRLERLPVVVGQVLREKAHREEAARLQDQILCAKREWELTFDTIPDPVLMLDEQCLVRRANRATCEVFGLPFSELIGRPCYQVLHGRSDPLPECPHQHLLATGHPQSGDFGETRLGRIFHCTTTPLQDPQGALRGCLHVLRDVTEHRQMEQAVRESEKQYRELVENATYGIYRSSPDGHFLNANPALVAMLGYGSKEALLAVSLNDIYEDPSQRASVIDRFAQGEESLAAEAKWKRADGKTIIMALSGRALRDEDGRIRHFDVVAEDITERRTLEEQFRQAQKMEAVGRLAGGVAHDFNNLLGVIIGYSDLLLPEVGSKEQRRVNEIKNAANRAVELTRQLLAFSRKQVLEPKVLDLNAVVKGISGMLVRLVGEDIQLNTQLSPGLGAVKADPAQLEQIIMNLAVNGRDAMPNGGKLTIETANVELDSTYTQRHVQVSPGSYVMLAVSDNGTGMAEDVKDRIFEPFFTTKVEGRGTGLGLSTVYGIVKQSCGYVWVYSEPGEGSTFKVYLPRVQDALEGIEHREEATPTPRGSETILLVEDAASLRELNHELLQGMGFTVLTANDGAEAIRTADQYPDPIHLLLTDVVMPGVNGRVLAERLKQSRPTMRVLFMSGYTDNVIVHHAILESGVAFLQKPFTRDVLAKKVREVLGRLGEPASPS